MKVTKSLTHTSRTLTVGFAALALVLTMVGSAGAATVQPAAPSAGSSAGAIGLSADELAAALEDPGVAKEARRIQAQMQDPAVVAQARQLLASGAFTVSTGSQSDPRYLSVGGCGFLRLCIYFNRTEQRYIAAGAGAAVAAAICIAGTPAACVVAATLVAIAGVFISDRGGICSGRLRVQILPYPGRPRCV